MSYRIMIMLATLAAAPAARAAAEPFDYFRNSWNVIALKDYARGTRVTPDNRLLLDGKSAVTIRFGKDLTPLSRKQTKTLLDGWQPIILLTASEAGVRYDFTLWASPLPSVKDWAKAYDWPTEGEDFLNWVQVKATNTGAAPAGAKVKLERAGGASARQDDFAWTLAPGQSAERSACFRFSGTDSAAFAKEDAKLWLDRTAAFWRGLIEGPPAARIDVPCAKATAALKAAHVCQFICNDHGQLKGGEGFYDEFFIRDGAYQIMELEEAGLMDAAAKAIEFFLKAQRPDGRFETQKNQFDANGQAIWAIWQYYRITGDKKFLQRAYPQMKKAADWAIKARQQAPKDSPFANLLPAAPADGECLWDGKHHIPGYDIWNARGMACTSQAARELGKEDRESIKLSAESAHFAIWIRKAVADRNLTFFPPSWEKAGTHWGNTETLWPTELFGRESAEVVGTIDEVRQRHGGGFCEGTIRWTGQKDVIHPYMSAYTTMADLVRGRHEQVVEDFYWYLLHSTAAHAFPEGIYYKRRYAWSETIPHPTGASNYAIMLRHMLVHERDTAGGEELHLLPAVPDWWLGDGQTIRVERLPTHLGQMAMTVTGKAGGVEVDLVPPRRDIADWPPPKKIVLHLPRSRPLLNKLEGVEVALRDDQKKKWDFPTVVAGYLAQAPQVKPIPHLVALPPAQALDPPLAPPQAQDRCVLLDLSAVANTDPFTAPFGVPKPGKFLFTGLKTGVQPAAGVPFRIIDPAANGGKGMVVLHADHAPKNIPWPKEVTIPVNQKGKRMFFLGNVHGWDPGDAGAGQWGAVGEYVIHYADGQTQTVPLVTGRTADDWASPPSADQATVGLKGDPWHLNVLGTDLRDAAVEKVVFRDTGTPAAPLLAGITIEKR